MTRAHALAIAILIAGLAACQPAPMHVLSEYAVTPDYARQRLDDDLTGRAIRVSVVGNPFDVPPEAFAGQIAAQMTDAHAFDVRFVARGADIGVPGYDVVWDFAPPRELAPDEICAEREARRPRAPLPIDAYVALCHDGKALTAVRAKLYYTDTQNSLEFIALVDDTTRALFPTQLPALRRPGDARIAPQVPHVAR